MTVEPGFRLVYESRWQHYRIDPAKVYTRHLLARATYSSICCPFIFCCPRGFCELWYPETNELSDEVGSSASSGCSLGFLGIFLILAITLVCVSARGYVPLRLLPTFYLALGVLSTLFFFKLLLDLFITLRFSARGALIGPAVRGAWNVRDSSEPDVSSDTLTDAEPKLTRRLRNLAEMCLLVEGVFRGSLVGTLFVLTSWSFISVSYSNPVAVPNQYPWNVSNPFSKDNHFFYPVGLLSEESCADTCYTRAEVADRCFTLPHKEAPPEEHRFYSLSKTDAFWITPGAKLTVGPAFGGPAHHVLVQSDVLVQSVRTSLDQDAICVVFSEPLRTPHRSLQLPINSLDGPALAQRAQELGKSTSPTASLGDEIFAFERLMDWVWAKHVPAAAKRAMAGPDPAALYDLERPDPLVREHLPEAWRRSWFSGEGKSEKVGGEFSALIPFEPRLGLWRASVASSRTTKSSLRTYYCNVCRQLVVGWDHFCPFVGANISIGGNYKELLLFLVYSTLLAALCFLIVALEMLPAMLYNPLSDIEYEEILADLAIGSGPETLQTMSEFGVKALESEQNLAFLSAKTKSQYGAVSDEKDEMPPLYISALPKFPDVTSFSHAFSNCAVRTREDEGEKAATVLSWAPPFIFPEKYCWFRDTLFSGPYTMHRRRQYRPLLLPGDTPVFEIDITVPEQAKRPKKRVRIRRKSQCAIWRRSSLHVALAVCALGWWAFQGGFCNTVAVDQSRMLDGPPLFRLVSYLLFRNPSLGSVYHKLLGGNPAQGETWWCVFIPSANCRAETYGLNGVAEFLWREYGVSKEDWEKYGPAHPETKERVK